MKFLKRHAFPIFIFILVLLLSWFVYSANTTISRLQNEGKDYNVGIATYKQGANGKSAYELAVDEGFEGSQTEWLLSLIVISPPGADGKDGANGLDAYEIAIKQGYSGTEIDWLNSLRGADGLSIIGPAGADGLSIVGPAGENGRDGIDGNNSEPIIRACVERNPGGVVERWISWKYASQPDTAYQDIHQIFLDTVCKITVNMKETI